ncbi:MAG: nitronate monooxygenase [Acholeplasmataceae bacterium]
MNKKYSKPTLIQGGMGIGVSSHQLANTVSREGGLGVVSLTAVTVSFLRRLMDKEEDYLNACEGFIDPEFVKEVTLKYYGKKNNEAYQMIEMPSLNPSAFFLKAMVLSSYVEVSLAKKGHHGVIGINMLEKIQIPTLPLLFGAMLAGVDYVIMGAGIPIRMPQIIDKFSNKEKANYLVKLNDSSQPQVTYEFVPNDLFDLESIEIKKPKFLAVVSSLTLANYLLKATHKPDGFIIELPTAGGHNARPRGELVFDETGEPVYGKKDEIDFEGFRKLGYDFWLAGGFGSHEKYKEALSLGAVGIQVGSAFAFCEESGFTKEIKEQVIKQVLEDNLTVKMDFLASPTGFPFKVADVLGSLHDDESYQKRKRICDLGYLREAYEKPDGKIGYRCPSEPVEDYVRKGGNIEDTVGRKCLCNGLVSAIGVAQSRASIKEKSIVTAGNDAIFIKRFIKPGNKHYQAIDVINHILYNK